MKYKLELNEEELKTVKNGLFLLGYDLQESIGAIPGRPMVKRLMIDEIKRINDLCAGICEQEDVQ